MCALLYVNVSNVRCFTCIPVSGSKCEMFAIWHMSPEGVNNMFSFIYKYLKSSLFRIYSLVGVDNMCTFIQQYFKCLLFRMSEKTIGALFYQYFKCLLFCIYSRVGVNNMYTFIAIFLMLVFI